MEMVVFGRNRTWTLEISWDVTSMWGALWADESGSLAYAIGSRWSTTTECAAMLVHGITSITKCPEKKVPIQRSFRGVVWLCGCITTRVACWWCIQHHPAARSISAYFSCLPRIIPRFLTALCWGWKFGDLLFALGSSIPIGYMNGAQAEMAGESMDQGSIPRWLSCWNMDFWGFGKAGCLKKHISRKHPETLRRESYELWMLPTISQNPTMFCWRSLEGMQPRKRVTLWMLNPAPVGKWFIHVHPTSHFYRVSELPIATIVTN